MGAQRRGGVAIASKIGCDGWIAEPFSHKGTTEGRKNLQRFVHAAQCRLPSVRSVLYVRAQKVSRNAQFAWRGALHPGVSMNLPSFARILAPNVEIFV